MLPPERLTGRQFARRLGLALGMVLTPVMVTGFAASAAAKALGLPSGMVSSIAVTIVVVLAYRFYVHRIEKRRVLELAGDGAWRETGAGVLVGSALFAAVIGVLAASGAYVITGRGTLWGVASVLVMSIGAGVIEEILCRGILYRLLESAFGSLVGVVTSAVIFGGLHAMAPHATLASLAAIALEAGVLLAVAYALTRRLWFAIAIHFAWNFMQGGIFGAPVSGNVSKGLFIGTLQGPEWLTGGEFGPEASVVSIVVCVCAAAVLAWCAWRRGRFVPAPWRARGDGAVL